MNPFVFKAACDKTRRIYLFFILLSQDVRVLSIKDRKRRHVISDDTAQV